MARAMVTALLVSGLLAVVGVLLGTKGVFENMPIPLLIATPIAVGWLVAARSPGTWPAPQRPGWNAGVAGLVAVAGGCGLVVGGILGLNLAFGMGLIYWGY